MKTSYKIGLEDSVILRARIKITKNKTACRRMEAVALLGEGKTPNEVSDIKKYNSKYVRNLGLLYNKEGLEALAQDNRKGGNRRNMRLADEKALLESFKKAAQAGQIIEVGEIKRAYEEAIRRSLDSSRGQIYRVLERHDWRKLMPRSKHPNKASDEEIESSKKLTIA